MLKIDGIDLFKTTEVAAKAYAKEAESKITGYVQGQMAQLHSLRMKVLRLRSETEQSENLANAIEERIKRIAAGDWDAVEPFEMGKKSE